MARVKKSTYKMKGSPMQRNFPSVFKVVEEKEKTTTKSGESKGNTAATNAHWNAGAINTTGTKIVNEQGEWTDINGVAGKKLKGKYAKTNYAENVNAPSGDVVNVDKTKRVEL